MIAPAPVLDASPRARVVLLGASNVTTGLGAVLAAAHRLVGPGPLEALVAAGHGRSYGQWSRVLLRGLPGILDCGLWSRARWGGDLPTYALVTDVGNDLAYGAPAADVAAWVAACLERLRDLQADTVLTLLPGRSLARLRPWTYHVLKAVLFPGRRLPFPVVLARVAEVNARLRDLAAGAGVAVVEPDAEWYGPDRIHIRRSRRGHAWSAILGRWGGSHGPVEGPGAPPGFGRLRGAPEYRTLAGIALRRRQPSLVLADGSGVSLF